LRELQELARKHGLPRGSFGAALGTLFSESRQRIADHLFDAERSYRATLLGMRHGTDVARVFEVAAALAGRQELAQWAHTWLAARTPLVREAERQLVWFAAHAEHALARAH
jgi:hypothetical protein